MKTNNFFMGAGLLLLFASCETSRQATNHSVADVNAVPVTTSTTSARNSGTTMNSPSPVSASAADPMLYTPAAVASANSSATAGKVVTSNNTVNTTSAYPHNNTVAVTNSNQSVTNVADTTPNASRKGMVITAPQNIEATFKTQFPNATNVQWYQYNRADVPIDWELTGWPTLSDRDYAVVYNVDNTPYYGWYDVNGNWVGSTSRLANHSSLPAAVQQLISTKYPGYSLSEVHAETYKDQSGYEIEMAKGTDKIKMVVDANGNVLKQKTKTMGADGKMIKDKIKN